MKNHQQLIGVHVSIKEGFFSAIEEGTVIGCTAIQIFTKSNRRWAAKAISDKEVDLFLEKQKNSAVHMVVSHAAYLINLGSVNPDVQKKSYIALVDEIQRCHKLRIPFLILHPGTMDPKNKDASLQAIGSLINKALEETVSTPTSVLIETMAGQGNSAGSSFEELAIILHQIKDASRIGICFDTCHIFAAGYDITTPQGYAQTFTLFGNIIGMNFLKLIHLNDSKKGCGSRVDRHENIGEGMMGLETFARIINDPALQLVPKILETPHADDLENDKKNINTVLNLIQ